MHEDKSKQSSRRQFLEGAGVLSGALVLGRLAQAAEGDAAADTKADATADNLVLKLADVPELGKAGGFKVVDLDDDSVIVARTPDGIIACSAICTHKGCKVEYHLDARSFICPCHKAQYDETGKVTRGPAKLPLAPYSASEAIIVAAADTKN